MADRSRVDRIAAALLVALAVAFAVVLLGAEGSSAPGGGRLGGDFPEFYGAGRIVRDGDAEHLYDAAYQARSQRDLFAGDETGYLDFAYPPVVALVYAPLSALPYRAAYAVQVVAMFAALAAALSLVRAMVPVVRDRFVVVLTGTLVFFPMFRAVGGGQNTALTLLCAAAAWRAQHDGRPVVAGLWLGALLYKPQFAVLFLAAHAVTRAWRVLAGAAATAAVLWVVSALVMGPGWTGPFLRHAQDVTAGDESVEGGGAVSLIGTAVRFDGDVRSVLVPIATIASVTVAVVCLAACRHAWQRGALGPGFAVLAAGSAVAVPHVIFYDAGMLVAAGLVALQRPSPRTMQVVGGAVVASFLGAFGDHVPLLAVGVAALMWALAAARAVPGPEVRA